MVNWKFKVKELPIIGTCYSFLEQCFMKWNRVIFFLHCMYIFTFSSFVSFFTKVCKAIAYIRAFDAFFL